MCIDSGAMKIQILFQSCGNRTHHTMPTTHRRAFCEREWKNSQPLMRCASNGFRSRGEDESETLAFALIHCYYCAIVHMIFVMVFAAHGYLALIFAWRRLVPWKFKLKNRKLAEIIAQPNKSVPVRSVLSFYDNKIKYT